MYNINYQSFSSSAYSSAYSSFHCHEQIQQHYSSQNITPNINLLSNKCIPSIFVSLDTNIQSIRPSAESISIIKAQKINSIDKKDIFRQNISSKLSSKSISSSISNSRSSSLKNLKNEDFKAALDYAHSSIDKRLANRVLGKLNKRTKCRCGKQLDNAKNCNKIEAIFQKFFKPAEISALENIYQKICKQECGKGSKVQALKDVTRTFAFHKFFASQDTQDSLLKILCNLSIYFQSTGYVQGMNYLAAAIFYHANECTTFWLTVQLFDEMKLNQIFKNGMPGLLVHFSKVEEKFMLLQPKLFKHLNENGINSLMYLTDLIITLLLTLIPFEFQMEHLQNILTYKWEYIYYCIVLLFESHSQEILLRKNMDHVLLYIKKNINSSTWIAKDLLWNPKEQWPKIIMAAVKKCEPQKKSLVQMIFKKIRN